MDESWGATGFIVFGVLPFLLLVAVVSGVTFGILVWVGGRGRPRP
ncbi:hypothetical protein EDF54_2153 [Rathayibacter sp. PhB93]|jgi:hypothetical protein|nr:hypothetical protein EDF54_2153 [Rathayibacter sp. PhB93]TDQ12395.1 hypothetical protein EDF17_2254 [Rathayibacter sp. PhB1]